MTLAFRVYFRRIEVKGANLIPSEGPVLLACNHPSSFLEGCLVSCFQDRELHYLVRGDVFRIKWLKPLLVWTNQIPIFRFRDGFSSMKKNRDTFQTTYKVLSENAAVIIYPEGSTELVKQLRPLQKGLAKLSMGALKSYPDLPLKIVPVGVNYNDALSFRSSVTVSIGEPYDAKDYVEAYKNDAHDTVRRMTREAHQKLVEHIVHLEDPEKPGCDELLTAALHFNTKNHSGVIRDGDGFERQVRMAKYINDSSETFSDFNLKESLTHLDLSIFQRTSTLWMWLQLIILSPFALLGFILNFIPYWLGKMIAAAKVKHIEFKAAVRIAVWALTQILYCLIIAVILVISGCGWLSLLAFLLPGLGIFTIRFYEIRHRLRMTSRYSDLIEQLESRVGTILS